MKPIEEKVKIEAFAKDLLSFFYCLFLLMVLLAK